MSFDKERLIAGVNSRLRGYNSVKLAGEYDNPQTETELKKALQFWEVMAQDSAWPLHLNDTQCREILAHFRNSKNRFIRIIATLESLPTPVFRRALWYYNIDFLSRESFLRRITDEEVEGLERTYDTLFEGNAPRVPECCTEGLKNRIRNWLWRNKWNPAAILRDTYGPNTHDRHERYRAKGKIAYEFFGLDFGFNTYRSRVSDKKVEGGTARQFLSNKTQELDFTVNEEDGIYTWFYQVVRSNWLWRPGKKVELKPAICPGFWFTFCAWFAFLAVSPLALFAGGTLTLFSGEFSGISSWTTAAIGCITPGLLLAACGRHYGTQAIQFVGEDILKPQEAEKITIWFSMGIFWGAIIFGTGYLTHLWWKDVLFGWQHWLIVIFMTLFVFHYIASMIHRGEWRFPTSTRLIGVPFTALVLSRLIFDYREFILVVLEAVWLWFVAHWVGVAIVVVFIGLGVLAIFQKDAFSEAQQKKYRTWVDPTTALSEELRRKLFYWLALTVLGIYTTLAVGFLVATVFQFSTTELAVLVGITIAVFLVPFLLISWTEYTETKRSHKRREKRLLVERELHSLFWNAKGDLMKACAPLFNHKWIMAGDVKAVAQRIDGLLRLIGERIPSCDQRFVARCLSKKVAVALEDDVLLEFPGERRANVLLHVYRGASLEEAVKAESQEIAVYIEKKQTRNQKKNRALEAFKSSFRWLATPIVVIWEFFSSVYVIWENFNKKCPFKTRAERIS